MQLPILLFEEKSINNIVSDCVDFIEAIIRSNFKEGKHYISPITKVPYFNNELQINVRHFFPKLNYLNVEFYLYDCQNQQEYNQLIQNDEIQLNSEADYEEHYLRIVSCLINGEPIYDLTQSLFHEVTHLFQYEQGMQKRVNLYDRVRESLNDEDKYKQIIAKCLYYTFKHEQDAFTHQFYGFLQSTQFQGNFEEALNYTSYKQYQKLFKEYLDLHDYKVKQHTAFYFGYWPNNLTKKINFGLNRLKHKLKNAFIVYKHQQQTLFQEAIQNTLLESEFKTQIKFEKYYQI